MLGLPSRDGVRPRGKKAGLIDIYGLEVILWRPAGRSGMLTIDRDGPEKTRKFSMTDMTVVQDKMKAIATAHADYARSSFEANKAYLEKLATAKAPDQAMQITADHMKLAYETFAAEATKITEMYKNFFTSAFEPMTVGIPKLQIVE